jgi:hypothetical protein
MEQENWEITNEPLRVTADNFVHITQYVYHHKPDVPCDFVYSDISAIGDGSTANRQRRICDPGGMQSIHTASIMDEKATFQARGVTIFRPFFGNFWRFLVIRRFRVFVS